MSHEVLLSVVVWLSTVLATTVFLAILAPLLEKRQLVDVPNHRSSHTSPTLRGGGVAISAGVLLGVGVGRMLTLLDSQSSQLLAAFTMSIIALSAIGWIEDSRGLAVRTRFAAQALIVCATVISTDFNPGGALVAAFAGVFYVNAANFMDGVNGISSLHGTLVGGYFTVVAILNGTTVLAIAGAATAAAFLAFLPWNARRARMFMGDVGSYALGAAVWGLALLAYASDYSLIAAICPLFVYTSDVLLTLVRRAWNGSNLLESHNEHIYQTVQQATRSHHTAAALPTAATAISCVGGALQVLGVASPAGAWMLSILAVLLYVSVAITAARTAGR